MVEESIRKIWKSWGTQKNDDEHRGIDKKKNLPPLGMSSILKLGKTEK